MVNDKYRIDVTVIPVIIQVIVSCNMRSAEQQLVSTDDSVVTPGKMFFNQKSQTGYGENVKIK